MDLTFTDSDWTDIGIIEPTHGDFAWGVDENDFSIDVADDAVPEIGALLYHEGSDLGGIVTGYQSDAATDTFAVIGDTWTGVLERHVLGPDAGSAYYSVSGDAADCVRTIISRLGLSNLFVVDGKCGVVISHTFTGSRSAVQGDTGRYMGGWSAIWQMVSENRLKCMFAWDDARHKVSVRVVRRDSYTDDESASVGVTRAKVSTKAPTNHLVCLGKGDLADRMVLHLYADSIGNVSTRQTFFGIDEIAEVYDNSSAEDATALKNEGAKRLRELHAGSMTVTVASNYVSKPLDLGDLMGGTDVKTGIYATATVTKKVATFSDGEVTYTYDSTTR